MAGSAAGKLFSGLVVGAAVGAAMALVLSSRASGVALPGQGTATDGTVSGPTPFEPANQVIARAQHLVREVRAQIQLAVAEGKATTAQTRLELTTRFEAAKHAPGDAKLSTQIESPKRLAEDEKKR